MSAAGETLARLVSALDGAGAEHMIVGSFASTFHGEPRTTQDIDIDVVVQVVSDCPLSPSRGQAAPALSRRLISATTLSSEAPQGGVGYDLVVNNDSAAAMAEVRELVDEYRASCLWYLRRDYQPATREEALRVLDAIARHGDMAAFRRAERLRAWLSPTSSAPSAAS